MKSIADVRKTLHAALGSDALFALVNTRLTLKTGIDLNQPVQQDDAATLGRVIDALKGMGYSPEVLMAVAKRNQKG